MKRKILIIFLLILIIQLVFSQNNKILNLNINDAINLALAKNLGIKIEKLNFDEKKWTLITVWNTFFPDIKLSASLSKINQEILDYEFEKIKEDYEDRGIDLTNSEVYDTYEWDKIRKGNVTASFNITLDLSAKMIFDVVQTVLEYNSGKISLEIAKKDIERNMR